MHPKAFNTFIGFVSALSLCTSTAIAQPSQPTEVTSGDITFSVRFDNLAGSPELGTDFSVTFDGSDVPTVNLLIGRTGGGTLLQWRVWCKDSADDPADIAEIKALTDYDFDVKVLDDSGDAGAANLTYLTLVPSGADKFSNLTDARITGDLSGALTLQEGSGGTGGELTFTIDGDVSGDATIPKVLSFTVGGDVSGDLNVEAIQAGGVLRVQGDVVIKGVGSLS